MTFFSISSTAHAVQVSQLVCRPKFDLACREKVGRCSHERRSPPSWAGHPSTKAVSTASPAGIRGLATACLFAAKPSEGTPDDWYLTGSSASPGTDMALRLCSVTNSRAKGYQG